MLYGKTLFQLSILFVHGKDYIDQFQFHNQMVKDKAIDKGNYSRGLVL